MSQVFYGGAGGITSVDDMWHQAVSGVNGVAEAGDRFGAVFAAGNYNGDTSGGRACDHLAIASPGEDVGSIADADYLYIIDAPEPEMLYVAHPRATRRDRQRSHLRVQDRSTVRVASPRVRLAASATP